MTAAGVRGTDSQVPLRMIKAYRAPVGDSGMPFMTVAAAGAAVGRWSEQSLAPLDVLDRVGDVDAARLGVQAQVVLFVRALPAVVSPQVALGLPTDRSL